jgi:peptide-methionine (R)-S-oxide reductase
MKFSEEELKKKLTPMQYEVLRNKGTEPRFYDDTVKKNDKGLYKCAVCGTELFKSDSKFDLPEYDPNYGWPSFSEAATKGSIVLEDDDRYGMHRTEVKCANCGSHLGHLFDDGPQDKGGMHYCVNGCALNFEKSSNAKASEGQG